MNEMHAKLPYWTGTNTGLGEGRKPVSAANSQDSNVRATQFHCSGTPHPALYIWRREASRKVSMCCLLHVVDYLVLLEVSTQPFSSPEILAISTLLHLQQNISGFASLACSRRSSRNSWLIDSLKLFIPMTFFSLSDCNTARGCYSSTEVATPAVRFSTLRFALVEKVFQSCNYHQSCRPTAQWMREAVLCRMEVD